MKKYIIYSFKPSITRGYSAYGDKIFSYINQYEIEQCFVWKKTPEKFDFWIRVNDIRRINTPFFKMLTENHFQLFYAIAENFFTLNQDLNQFLNIKSRNPL